MASKIETDDLLTCPVCFEHFNRPKSLPCSHTFCYQCLRSYIISQLGGEGKKAGPFTCPVCRQEVPIPNPSLTSEKIADVLPGNHLITSLIDRAEVTDEGQRQKLCDSCNYDNRKTLAVSWCTVCLEGMCEKCTSYHQRIKSSRSHAVLAIANIPDDPQDMPLQEVDEPCLKHAGKILEVYCSDHKQMCCVLCLATNHRECKNISTLDEMVSGSENLESVEDFASYLKQIDEKSEELKVKTENNIKNLNKKQGEISGKVCADVQRAKDKLDELKTDFLTDLQQTHKEQSTTLIERKERVEIFQSCVKKAEKLLDVVRKQGSPRQLFVTMEKLKDQLLSSVKSLNEDLQDLDHLDYRLKMADAVVAVNDSLASLAELEINKTTGDSCNNVRDIQGIMERLCNKEPKTVDVSKIKVTEACQIGSMSYSGGTFLPDGRLILCSNCDQSLQAYQTTGTKLFEIQLNDYPRDVCVMSPSEVIVSFPETKCLKKYKVTQDTFIHMDTINVKFRPQGVVATKDNILVGHSDGVNLLSLDGKFIRTISQMSSRTMYFNQRTYVALSRCGIVCCGDFDDVVCVTLNGKKVTWINSQKLKCVSGIAVDRYENIYACGYSTKNVCVFSPNGKTETTLIENISGPLYGIGFNNQGTQLFITTTKGVLIFDVKYN